MLGMSIASSILNCELFSVVQYCPLLTNVPSGQNFKDGTYSPSTFRASQVTSTGIPPLFVCLSSYERPSLLNTVSNNYGLAERKMRPAGDSSGSTLLSSRFQSIRATV
jgi:hypothetical protein